MDKYKLHYFDIRGLGEPIRFLLAYLDEDYEDHRISVAEQWPSYKPQTPFGKVPVLEAEGKVFNQSIAISRWLGKKANLAGKNDLESLEIDNVAETFNDIRMATSLMFHEQNPEEKAQKIDFLTKEMYPLYMSRFEKMAQENGGYLANGSLSWADIYFVSVIDTLNFMMKFNILEKHPNLKALKEKIEKIPRIDAWIKKRPVTDL